MEQTISQILKSNYVDGVFHTHVSMLKPKGKYLFDRKTLENFWDMYCKDMLDEKKFGSYGIAENPQDYYPVIVDIDIKISEKDLDSSLRNKLNTLEGKIDDHIYSEKHITQVIEIFQSILRNILEDCNDSNLICCVFEKKIYSVVKNDVKYYKNGFHLAFQNIFLNRKDQENYLYPRVNEALKELEVFEDLGIEDSSSLFDSGIGGKPWLLYGSRKETSDAYKLTKIYDAELKEIELEDAFKYYQIYDNREQLIDIRGCVKQYLPRILSVIPYGRTPSEIKHGLESFVKERQSFKNKGAHKENIKATVDENLKMSEKLLPLLAQFRTEEYNEWMTIGWILYNIGDGCQEALDQWIDFSSRDEINFDEDECIRQWDKMTKKDYTIGTLKFYAKTDNPDLYREFVKDEGAKHIKASLEGSHTDIAKLLYAEYGTEFVCASVLNKTWYQFIGHHWEEIEEGVFLRDRISSDIVEKYGKLGGVYFAKAAGSDGSDEKSYQLRLKQIQKLIQQLKSTPYKRNVMTEAADIFYNKNFKTKLDTNPYLFGFKNGIYDLKLNVFRAGRPEDYMSNIAPIDYVNFSQTDKRVQDVYDFLQKVFPDTSVRKYFLDTSSDVFVGGNHQKVVIFWTGEGDNGKSVTQSIFEKMLGTLAIKFSTTLITGKKTQIGAAGPELARAGGGVRFAVLEEPDVDEEINVGMLKSLSGNDSYWARDLFEKGKSTREIQPLFKLVFICLEGNTPISLSSGVSISLNRLQDNTQQLLAWDSGNDSLTHINQHVFLDKGEQECVTIKLLDGREITCTPNHKFLTNNNSWIEAREITQNTQLKMGIHNPVCDDILDTYDYVLNCGDYCFNLVNVNEKFKAMAYVRLFAYKIGRCCDSVLYVENQLDCDSIISDIKLLTKDPFDISYIKNKLAIKLPVELSESFDVLTQSLKNNIPDFVYDISCPIFIIREFLSTIFGINSIINFNSIKLVMSDSQNYIDNMIEMFNKISELLDEKFNINSEIVKKYDNGEQKYKASLTIVGIKDMISFYETIGVRYSYSKLYRITSILSYFKYKNAIIDQNNSIFNRTFELIGNKYTEYVSQQIKNGTEGAFVLNIDENMSRMNEIYESIIDTNDLIVNQIRENEGLINDKCLIVYTQIKNTISYRMQTVSIKDFFEKTNLYEYYSRDIVTKLPCYNMSVIHVRKTGVKHVYDINVDEPYSNFIASGLVTHNCNGLPKMRYSDRATWNRIRVIPFESTFVRVGEPCPETFEEQLLEKRFPMDTEFSKKIPSLVPAFAWVLLEHRKSILGKERIEPEKVKAATALYRKQNDIYRQFIEERIIEDQKYIRIDELYDEFKIWYRNGFPGNSIPVKNEVKDYFVKMWDEPEPGVKWYGYRIRTIDDDVKDGSAIILDEDDLVTYDESNGSPL